MKIVGIIPAHLASVRFKQKVLFKFYGLEMIEHVRRRALLSSAFDQVIVATGDDEIASIVNSYGGNIVRTFDSHNNGTSRVSEAIKNIEATHIVVIQGDEPLILPNHLLALTKAIQSEPNKDAWNATADLNDKLELDKESFVKCSITEKRKILYCFRRSPSHALKSLQLKYIKKILGLIAYRREVLEELSLTKPSQIELLESIEQLRIIYNNFNLYSVSVNPSTPSLNEPGDEEEIIRYCRSNNDQKELLKKVLTYF